MDEVCCSHVNFVVLPLEVAIADMAGSGCSGGQAGPLCCWNYFPICIMMVSAADDAIR